MKKWNLLLKEDFCFDIGKVDLTSFLLRPNNSCYAGEVFPMNLVLQTQYFVLRMRGYQRGKILFWYFHKTNQYKSDFIDTRVN